MSAGVPAVATGTEDGKDMAVVERRGCSARVRLKKVAEQIDVEALDGKSKRDVGEMVKNMEKKRKKNHLGES